MPDAPEAVQAPTCPRCQKPMVLVSAAPSDNYTNLDVCHFRCECGEEGQFIMARKE